MQNVTTSKFFKSEFNQTTQEQRRRKGASEHRLLDG